MSKRSVSLRLKDMIDSIEELQAFTQGMDFEAFLTDLKTYRACYAFALILGEASAQLPQSFKDQYPDVPWKELKGFRNYLAHEYQNINSRVLFQVATVNAPTLLSRLQEILQDGV